MKQEDKIQYIGYQISNFHFFCSVFGKLIFQCFFFFLKYPPPQVTTGASIMGQLLFALYKKKLSNFIVSFVFSFFLILSFSRMGPKEKGVSYCSCKKSSWRDSGNLKSITRDTFHAIESVTQVLPCCIVHQIYLVARLTIVSNFVH